MAARLTAALLLGGCLGSLAVSTATGTEAAADPPTTISPPPPTSTTTPEPTSTPAPTTPTTEAPPTAAANVPDTTIGPPSITAPPVASPPIIITLPADQPAPAAPPVVATVVSTGDGLLVRTSDGTESPAQVGQSLQAGDQLSTSGSPGSSTSAHPATIQWSQGGMTDIYDATPRIFVRGHKSVPLQQTTVSIDADPTPKLDVVQGFARFWFPASDKSRYGFVASTEAVVATVTGTDFTIGDDPATRTSTVGVTQDSVQVAPVNPALRAFQLSAGSQVQVTPDRVGPITPLADQSSGGGAPSLRSTTTLALWLVGLLLAVALVSGSVGVASLWRDRRRTHPSPVPAIPPRPSIAPDLLLAHAGLPGSTGLVALSAAETTDPGPATPHPVDGAGQDDNTWRPTHRVPPEGMKARAIPVADAGEVASLDPDLAVRVVEERGDWANVLSADGWSGWVDTRQLVRQTGPA